MATPIDGAPDARADSPAESSADSWADSPVDARTTGRPTHPRVGAVLAAAGRSTRMGFDKLLADLGGRPVLAWSAAVLASTGAIDRLIVVASPERVGTLRDVLAPFLPAGLAWDVVPGGERRRDSVEAGTRALDDCAWIVVHDGARPFLTSELVTRGLAAAGADEWTGASIAGGPHPRRRVRPSPLPLSRARERGRGEGLRMGASGAAVAALPVRDTIKRVEGGLVVETPPRAALRAVQTPQVFRRDLLLRGLAATSEDVTDEAMLMERIEVPVRVFEGLDTNFKITTPHDLHVARALLPLRAPGHVAGDVP